MGTLVNGIKEIFATSQTTATHLPVCASDGTPQGRISVGDLASVLGAINKNDTGVSDLNDLTTQGVYALDTSKANSPTGSGFFQYLQVIKSTNSIIQISYITPMSNGVFERYKYNNNWSNWERVSFDIPSFYKNYNSISALTNAVYGMKMQNINLSDTLNIADVGCYITTVNCENAPETGGHVYYIIALMSNTTGERFCIAFDASNAHIYYGFLKTGVSVRWVQAV